MGRPALLGSHPRGPQYRGVQVPPHYGNRPRWRKKRTTYLTQCKNPKSIVPALGRSEMTIQDRRNHSRHQGKAKQTIIQDRVAQHNRHLHQTILHARTLPGGKHAEVAGLLPPLFSIFGPLGFAHQNRTIAIASDFRVDRAKSPEIPQKEGVLGSEIAARNRRSLATFHRTLKSQCSIAFSVLGNRAWGPRWASQSQIAKIAAIKLLLGP